MLTYYRKYVLLCIAVPIVAWFIVSGLWASVTGTMLLSTIQGLLGAIVGFVGILAIMSFLMGRVAQRKTDELIALYDEQCDPEAFVNGGSSLAVQMKPAYNAVTSWFISTFAQALLDLGRTEKAREYEQNVRSTIQSVMNAPEKVSIIANALGLVQKISGERAALDLAQEGLDLVGTMKGPEAARLSEFLEGQKRILSARLDGNDEELKTLCQAVYESDDIPMRLRVQYAFDGAGADYRLGDAAAERDALRFVVGHGNKLALVPQAQRRLDALDAIVAA